MTIVVPVTLLVIFVLLYLNFGRLTETLIVMLSVPFALIGGIWLMYLLGFNISVAAAVGFIALAGVAVETGVIMLIYLDHALRERQELAEREERPLTRLDLRHAIIQGAVERVRPKMMTVTAIMAGLLPILWSTGTGSELMRRIAAPMVGGMISSAALTLLVIPAIYSNRLRLASAARPPYRRGRAAGTAHPAVGREQSSDDRIQVSVPTAKAADATERPGGAGRLSVGGRSSANFRATKRKLSPQASPQTVHIVISSVCRHHAPFNKIRHLAMRKTLNTGCFPIC